MSKPRILISNDDGIHAQGISALTEHLSGIGEVWVVAPDRERSATSHSLSLHKPLRVRQLGERRYCVDGTPADCVYLALHHIMGTSPDIVVSGINHGANLGNDVIYSGTVSAAMEGALFGHRAMALSLCMPADAQEDSNYFNAAAAVSVEIVEGALAQSMPPGVLLNVNIPWSKGDFAGIKLCRLGYTTWTDHVDVRFDPRNRPYYWIGGQRGDSDATPDSDSGAIVAGYVAVTPIHYDVTDYRSFAYVRELPLRNLKRGSDGLGSSPLSACAGPVRRRRSDET